MYWTKEHDILLVQQSGQLQQLSQVQMAMMQQKQT